MRLWLNQKGAWPCESKSVHQIWCPPKLWVVRSHGHLTISHCHQCRCDSWGWYRVIRKTKVWKSIGTPLKTRLAFRQGIHIFFWAFLQASLSTSPPMPTFPTYSRSRVQELLSTAKNRRLRHHVINNCLNDNPCGCTWSLTSPSYSFRCTSLRDHRTSNWPTNICHDWSHQVFHQVIMRNTRVDWKLLLDVHARFKPQQWLYNHILFRYEWQPLRTSYKPTKQTGMWWTQDHLLLPRFWVNQLGLDLFRCTKPDHVRGFQKLFWWVLHPLAWSWPPSAWVS